MSAKKKTTPKKKTAPTKIAAASATTKKAAKKKTAPAKTKRPAARRADFGASVDGAFAKAPAQFQTLLAKLRALVAATVPKAEASLKWGQPFYMLGTKMLCGIGIHKNHVNVVFPGHPGLFVDPKGLLAGDATTTRHLKLTAKDEIPSKELMRWLAAAAAT